MSDIDVHLELIQWVRLGVLVLCFGGRLGLITKHVVFPMIGGGVGAKPTLFLLMLELLILEAGWMIWLTASAVVAFASTALIGVPDINDIRKGSKLDIIVTVWYFVSGVGLVMGAMEYVPVIMDYFDPSIVMDSDSATTKAALLWGQMILMGVVLFFFEMAWRFRMLHGGADAKAMMLATLLLLLGRVQHFHCTLMNLQCRHRCHPRFLC